MQTKFSLHSIVSIVLFIAMPSLAQDEKPSQEGIKERLVAPKGWSGEVIKLPPAFAKNMKFEGEEHIRFAPGMFKAKADDFFSYLFVFEIANQQKLTADQIQAEILSYYKGLGKAVWKKKDQPLDVEEFRFEIEEMKTPYGETGKFYKGHLKWKEPFVTSADQTLHMEIQSWEVAAKSDKEATKSYLLICVSPKEPDSDIWKAMRKIRVAFHK